MGGGVDSDFEEEVNGEVGDQWQTGAAQSLSRQYSAMDKYRELNKRVTIKMSALLVAWEEQKVFISLWLFHYVNEKD